MEVVYWVLDQMSDNEIGFCPDLSVTADQLDNFQAVPREDTKGGSGASELGVNVCGSFCFPFFSIFALSI